MVQHLGEIKKEYYVHFFLFPRSVDIMKYVENVVSCIHFLDIKTLMHASHYFAKEQKNYLIFGGWIQTQKRADQYDELFFLPFFSARLDPVLWPIFGVGKMSDFRGKKIIFCGGMLTFNQSLSDDLTVFLGMRFCEHDEEVGAGERGQGAPLHAFRSGVAGSAHDRVIH